MGALRGRSLDFRGIAGEGAGAAVVVCGDGADVGRDSCAASSLSLLPALCRSLGAGGGHFSSVPPPPLPEVMLVSGPPAFRGGGGRSAGSRVCGRCATDSVMSGRWGWEDWRRGRREEKGHLCARRQWTQRRVVAVAEDGPAAAKRKMAEMEGAAVRRVVIVDRDGMARTAVVGLGGEVDGGESGFGEDQVQRRRCCNATDFVLQLPHCAYAA